MFFNSRSAEVVGNIIWLDMNKTFNTDTAELLFNYKTQEIVIFHVYELYETQHIFYIQRISIIN